MILDVAKRDSWISVILAGILYLLWTGAPPGKFPQVYEFSSPPPIAPDAKELEILNVQSFEALFD